ncbi:MAG: hypothetical protein AAB922_00105 [Patescibacteria group bacterium]
MIENHTHNGANSPRLNINDVVGPTIITAELQVSARENQPSVLQRGDYTLAAGVKFVQFPYQYSSTTSLIIIITSKTANQQFLQGIVVSGFTVSGSGTDTGGYFSVGYK